MPRGRGRSRLGEWAQRLGEQIGAELGAVIAESVERTLERSIDPRRIARRLGRGVGRVPASRGACSEAGCEKPVLAKGLCRSHYYKARYQALKAAKPR